ncbi:MAG: pyruvate dehydrogenase (acetyl-transferring) E1 component subunit alpha [DPANN group archaeon]|nr:pyruvate dehydrogenase (acetyl-transferring) E1 component subunit alpha [DPANN group archaeon]
MPLKTLAKFEVPYLQILNEHGKVDGRLMPKLSDKDVLYLYETMVYGRLLDKTCLSLQREGRMYTYPSSEGQEAAQAGSAFALKPEDWMFPYFREICSHIVRGLPPEKYLLYWMGDERGQQIPENINNFMICVPVATQLPHAVGMAYALKYQKKKSAVLVYLGDGATSKGDFHEAMNLAGVWNLPVVFLCNNNQYAISTTLDKQTASKTLAQKAIAYGLSGIQVDGNDAFAVYKATLDAVNSARSGGGPTFIEAFTYRLGDHTTADDASKYRSAKEVEEWRKKDPITRLQKYLEEKKLWTQAYQKKLEEGIQKKINDIVKAAEGIEPQPVESIFNFTYSEMDWNLKEQLNSIK